MRITKTLPLSLLVVAVAFGTGRIALGGDSYTIIHKALTERLATLEAQRELAFSTDLPRKAQRELSR